MRLNVLFHQTSFLLTGLWTTLGTQWLFYKGAANSLSFLTQLSSYMGMILVGLLIPLLLRKRQEAYQAIRSTLVDMNGFELESHDRVHNTGPIVIESPVYQRSVMKLAMVDIVANSCATLGFSLIGSGMYQVIYSSVVIWCAILTYLFMNRVLSKIQWVAICGTSVGLAISSLENLTTINASGNTKLLAFGTLVTLAATCFYACMYVYSDHILSKETPSPLPARVCFFTGLYTTSFTVLYILLYTWPRIDQMIKIDSSTDLRTVVAVYGLLTLANATHAWNYYELIDSTGNASYPH
ncbi:uncharacterized protein BYT42DRAFT_587323 [Radiomyces spectabilis]|uniref:uncharacterized protein n=1 Tax=Radiomyces spectabilis TaxID=64574 RepID=UPI00221FB55E|nr:uncharacterized protein BYT42DRAFT_587323 [Radiomyces spectabilis]KAI8366640.1 hypothetical protein BYT42DRAFT_587323 [Radiomyces spectabilis]